MLRGTSSIKQDSLRLSTNCACVRCSKKGLDCSRLFRCWWVKGLSMCQAPFSPNCWARRPYIRNPASKKKHFGFGTAVRNCIILCASNILDKKFEVTTHITLKKKWSPANPPRKMHFGKNPRGSPLFVSPTQKYCRKLGVWNMYAISLASVFFSHSWFHFLTVRAMLFTVHRGSSLPIRAGANMSATLSFFNNHHLSLFPNLQEIVDDHPLMAVLHLSNL